MLESLQCPLNAMSFCVTPHAILFRIQFRWKKM
uniref:Uncharacterized protein n=1 Tax=Arundo donax TaxID=35708 RepID=A0A0A9HG87_ARUDO